MDVKDYFENTEGMGILSTSDAEGRVDSAIYATPHVIDDQTIAFIMRPRTSLANVQQNPQAVYMYIETGPGYQGRRFYLEKTSIESNPGKVNQFRRSMHGSGPETAEAKLVYFNVTCIRPLVGDKEQL